MVPLLEEARMRVLKWELGEDRLLSLRHALFYRRPGLLGDHPRMPKSVLLVREVNEPEGWHVFGAGSAEPAVAWLTQQGRAFSLVAPESWEGAIRRRTLLVQRSAIETWIRPSNLPLEGVRPGSSIPIATRLLVQTDAQAFETAAPSWALLGWGEFATLLKEGAAVGVPDRSGSFAALAWVFESYAAKDSIAVATNPRYQRLGLGFAAAAELIRHIETKRGKTPVWMMNDSNVPSKGLARALGFSARSRETVLRWNL